MNYNIEEIPSDMSSDEESHMHQKLFFAQFQANQEYMMKYMMPGEGSSSKHVGFVQGHQVINRNREEADFRMYEHYFSENPRFKDDIFRRRYRMRRDLFLRIVAAVKCHDRFFIQRHDAVGKLGLSSFQKVTAAMRILAYGVPADVVDEYTTVTESTAIECLKKFCRAIIQIFSDEYLRSPNASDIARLLHIGKSHGFPGMLGSLDCMHWEWKNCPTAWHGQFTGRSGTPSIILEAVADYDLWFWHAYFGLSGTNNDINVLDSSNLFFDLANGITPSVRYEIRGKEYNMGYYLVDGIYPKWSTIVQTIHKPQGRKKKHFAVMQASCRKDVERAFGVLKSRFAIIANPVRFWRKNRLHDIMKTCIILHNMIIEDERELDAPILPPIIPEDETAPPPLDRPAQFEEFLHRHREIRDRDAHFELHNALIEHLWDEYSNASD